MKKNVLLLVVVLSLVVALVVSMTACGLTDTLKDLAAQNAEDGDDNTGDNGSGSAQAEFDYESSAAVAALESMRQDKGYLIRYNISATEDSESNTVSIGAKGDIYYVASGDSEYYYDASGEDAIVYYTKDSAEADWTKSSMEFSEYFTREDAIESMEAVIQIHSGWLTYYQGFISSMDGATKTTATVAGRSCDKYTFSAAALTGKGLSTARATYECYVDKSTSICLKWTQTLTAEGRTESWSMECVAFSTNPDLTLPTVEEADEE